MCLHENSDYFSKREYIKDKLPKIIQASLAEYMSKKKMNNLELARKIGVPASLISQYRAGTIKDMRIRNAILLADVFGVTLDQFLGLSDDTIKRLTLPKKQVLVKFLELDEEDQIKVEEYIDSLREK